MLQYHNSGLAGKKVVEIGAGGGLVGLAVALGCDLADGQKLYITDQIPMLALMKRNIALNHLEQHVEALVYDWGSPPPIEVCDNEQAHATYPDVVLAADCVYFEPAFPLLLQTLDDVVGPDTICYFCFKKRRKADMRFIRDMMKRFAVELVDYAGRDADQRQAISLYQVTLKSRNKKSC